MRDGDGSADRADWSVRGSTASRLFIRKRLPWALSSDMSRPKCAVHGMVGACADHRARLAPGPVITRVSEAAGTMPSTFEATQLAIASNRVS